MNTPLKILKAAVTALRKHECAWCLIGGHAASLYRLQERLTKDVDFALVGRPASRSRATAAQVIRAIGLKPVLSFIPPRPGEAGRPALGLVTSEPPRGASTGIIDILLPVLPWLEPAVERAQHNLIDLGFARIPVITPEDLIVAKSYALRNSPDRFQDLDDLRAIFEGDNRLDLDYLRAGLGALKLSIPELVRPFAPRGL